MLIKKSDLSQEIALEVIDACIECGICVKNCVMLKQYTHSPKALLSEEIKKEIPFSCQLCDHCKSVCPKNIDLKAAFFSLRKDAQDQKLIKTASIDFHQRNSFSPLFMSKLQPTERLFFPGCSLSAAKPQLVMDLYDYIKEDDMGIWASCCGNPTHTLGKKNKFDGQLDMLVASFETNGVKELIVACQNCYKVFSEHTDIKVTSVFEILEHKELPIRESIDGQFALHDPCPTRNYKVIHDSVRSVCDKIGITFEEFQFNREKTQCCGSGAMVFVTNKMIADTQSANRVNQSDADTILTYCQECVTSFSQDKPSIHLLDLIFGVKDQPSNLVKKWMNRRQLKVKIDKLNKQL